MLAVLGHIPAKQLTLLDMLKNDGWEIVKQLSKLPPEMFLTAPQNSYARHLLLEYRTDRRGYVETFVGSGEASQSKIDRKSGRVADGTVTVTVQKTTQGRL